VYSHVDDVGCWQVLDVFNNGRDIFVLAQNEEPFKEDPPPVGTPLEQLYLPNLPEDEELRAMLEA
jgi:hypothetical protein